MKRLVYTALFYAALCCGPAHAGQVILTLPDDQLKGAIEEVCLWRHCESPDNGGYKSDEEKALWVADHLIEVVSMGHFKNLKAIDGTIEIHYDTP